MTERIDTLTLSQEIATHMEKTPSYASGLAHMSDKQFLTVALRAKRLLQTRYSRAGHLMQNSDETLPELCPNASVCACRKNGGCKCKV